MSELYWITRLDSITSTFELLIFFSLVIGIASAITVSVFYQEEDEVELVRKSSKCLKIASIVLFISAVFRAFIPTTKEACAIYGIGTTLEYMQESKEIKQLPDKAVKCINLFLDKYIEEEQSNKK